MALFTHQHMPKEEERRRTHRICTTMYWRILRKTPDEAIMTLLIGSTLANMYCDWKIVNSVGMHPYHYRKVQELTSIDREPRISLCTWLLSHAEANVLFSDECLFTRVGLFNQRDDHWWSFRNPMLTRQNSFQHRFSVNVWAGILNDQIVGPYFIEGRLTGENYLNLIRTMVSSMLDDIPLANLETYGSNRTARLRTTTGQCGTSCRSSSVSSGSVVLGA